MWSDWWNISEVRECQLCNVSLTLKLYETCTDILSDAKHFSYMLRKRTFCMNHFRLRDCTIFCKDHEYIGLAETMSRGQSYEVLKFSNKPFSGQTHLLRQQYCFKPYNDSITNAVHLIILCKLVAVFWS